MTNDARTEAKEFLRLQEAATGPEWLKLTSNDVFSAIIAPNKATICLDVEEEANADFMCHARNTALPRLTLEVVAENEKLREVLNHIDDVLGGLVGDYGVQTKPFDENAHARRVCELRAYVEDVVIQLEEQAAHRKHEPLEVPHG